MPNEVLALTKKLNGENIPALLDCICADNQEYIDLYLAEGVNLNSPASRTTALTWHTDYAHQKVNYTNRGTGNSSYHNLYLTALHYAVIEDKPELIGKLVTHNANIEAKCEVGYTPFLYAVASGKESSIDKLIELRCNVKAINTRGQGAIELAIQRGNLDFVKYCVDKIEADSEDLYLAFSRLKDCRKKIDRSIALYLAEQSIKIKSEYLEHFISISFEIDKSFELTLSIIKYATSNDQQDLLKSAASQIALYSERMSATPTHDVAQANNTSLIKTLLRAYFKSKAPPPVMSIDEEIEPFAFLELNPNPNYQNKCPSSEVKPASEKEAESYL